MTGENRLKKRLDCIEAGNHLGISAECGHSSDLRSFGIKNRQPGIEDYGVNHSIQGFTDRHAYAPGRGRVVYSESRTLVYGNHGFTKGVEDPGGF